LGVKAPMYCTGIGKAMLAYMPQDAVEQIVDGELKAYTENTITEKEALLQDLREIVARGYSIDNMEHEFGIKCIGMPLRNQKRQVVAGISISGPSLRFDDQKIQTYALHLKQIIG